MSTTTEIAGRLRRLSDTLAELKERVRSAVACEAGKAVGEAIRDLLTASLSGRMTSSRPMHHASRSDWEDDRESWEDNDSSRYMRSRPDSWRGGGFEESPPPRPAVKLTTSWTTAFAVGAAAVRWWITRSVPGWAALGIGVVVSVAAFAGGPIAQASLSLVAAAADLAPAVHPFSEWGLSPHST